MAYQKPAHKKNGKMLIQVKDAAAQMLNPKGKPMTANALYAAIKRHQAGGKKPKFDYVDGGNYGEIYVVDGSWLRASGVQKLVSAKNN